MKQERDLTSLRHEEELRNAQSRVNEDGKRAQVLESKAKSLEAKHEALSAELRTAREDAASERSQLERKFRAQQEQAQNVQDELDEARSEIAQQERRFEHEISELRKFNLPVQQALEEMRVDCDNKAKMLATARNSISRSEIEIAEKESEIIRLKAQSGDSETLALIKKELSDQVTHIQQLELHNTDLRVEIKRLKSQHRSIEVVEEEKRGLQSRLSIVDELRKELSEAQYQKQLLEDERNSWTSYLENVNDDGDNEGSIRTPEEFAKAYAALRLENLSMVDEIGKIKPESATKDDIIASLEDEKQILTAEVNKLRNVANMDTSGGAGSQSQIRLGQQRDLALKEVMLLRAQLKTFDVEQSEFGTESFDKANLERIQELETLVDKYREEIQSLVSDMATIRVQQEQKEDSPRKRPRRSSSPTAASMREESTRELEQNPRFSSLLARNRELEASTSEFRKQKGILEKDLYAAKSQIKSLKSASRTRILEFRRNPTAEHARVKQASLDALRAENVALLAALGKDDGGDALLSNRSEQSTRSQHESAHMVPQATLDRLRLDLSERDTTISTLNKKELRLKQRFSTIVLEYRTAVRSLLGWDLEIESHGRTKLTSVFYPTADGKPMKDVTKYNTTDESVPEEERNWIMFNGEEGTMKVSGGRQSRFARELSSLLEFWVDGRGEVPCFLAGCTMEFWEKLQERKAVKGHENG